MILGTFYFRITTSGNIVGEFINQESSRAATESADRRGGNIDRFDGEYQSTWFDGQERNMTLTILPKGDDFLNIFRLAWSDGTNDVFVGEAFLSNEMLIGVYGDSDLNNRINHLLTRLRR